MVLSTKLTANAALTGCRCEGDDLVCAHHYKWVLVSSSLQALAFCDELYHRVTLCSKKRKEKLIVSILALQGSDSVLQHYVGVYNA